MEHAFSHYHDFCEVETVDIHQPEEKCPSCHLLRNSLDLENNSQTFQQVISSKIYSQFFYINYPSNYSSIEIKSPRAPPFS